jgi:hypothetical protein
VADPVALVADGGGCERDERALQPAAKEIEGDGRQQRDRGPEGIARECLPEDRARRAPVRGRDRPGERRRELAHRLRARRRRDPEEEPGQLRVRRPGERLDVALSRVRFAQLLEERLLQPGEPGEQVTLGGQRGRERHGVDLAPVGRRAGRRREALRRCRVEVGELAELALDAEVRVARRRQQAGTRCAR